MEIIESVVQVLKEDSLSLSQTYSNLVSSVLFKVAVTVGGVEYAEYRVIGLDWAKEHGEFFTTYENVTQEQLVDWAKSKLTPFELSVIRSNVEARALFAGQNPTTV